MKPLWVLGICVAVALVLSLAVLEIVAERIHVEPLSAVSEPGDEASDSLQEVPTTARDSGGEITDVREARLPPLE